ncbi:MAG: hypothetical protein LLF89_03755 [Spirochaetaceae bacterium]|nr:hypothetical protein [Spirochaetaceae bacterium]
MSFFAIQVVTGKEDCFKDNFNVGRPDIQCFNIKKKMTIRRKGKMVQEITCLFPGYLFLVYPEEQLSPGLIHDLRKANWFLRILPATERTSPLNDRDSALINQLISFGKEIGPSLVAFTPDKKIRVIKGALMGLEGLIVSVNRRKRRVRVKTQLSDSPFVFDLSIDILETVEEQQK